MEMLEQPITKKDFIHLAASQIDNQEVYKKMNELSDKSVFIKEQLLKFTSENPKKPSKNHKALRKDLRDLENEMKKLQKTIKKFTAVKNAADKIGKRHGKIVLNGIRYCW